MKSLLIISLFLSQPVSFAKEKPQVIQMQVTEKGFEPSELNIKPSTHVILKVTRKTDSTCATQIKVSNKKNKTELPLNKEVTLDLGILDKGTVRYACGMNMVTGQLIVK